MKTKVTLLKKDRKYAISKKYETTKRDEGQKKTFESLTKEARKNEKIIEKFLTIDLRKAVLQEDSL